jgi:hypothetical protein
MGRWARAHSDRRTQHLPFPRHRIPALETFRTLLCRFDWSLLREALNGWLTAVNVERIRLDEKVLRGSQREGEAPWMGVAALGHRVGRVLGQMVAKGRDPTEAALALLEPISLEGRMVTLDAGWMTQPVVRKGVEKGGRPGADLREPTGGGGGGAAWAAGPWGDGTTLPMSGKFPRATVGWRSGNSGWRRARSGDLSGGGGWRARPPVWRGDPAASMSALPAVGAGGLGGAGADRGGRCVGWAPEGTGGPGRAAGPLRDGEPAPRGPGWEFR